MFFDASPRSSQISNRGVNAESKSLEKSRAKGELKESWVFMVGFANFWCFLAMFGLTKLVPFGIFKIFF